MTYVQVRVRTALNQLKRRDSWYGCVYTLNPYRGCAYVCPYCYSWAEKWRPPYKKQDAKGLTLNAFSGEDKEKAALEAASIFIKSNIASVLQRELQRKSKDVVFIGSATEPYQPCEQRFELTRRCLTILHRARWPVELGTKSTLVLRDLDLLQEIASRASCIIFMTITTLNEQLARILEPRAPSPKERLAAVRALSEAGIEVCVCMIPVFPGLTDTPSEVMEVAKAAQEHGARRFLAGALTLPGKVKRRFLQVVRQHFPHILNLYRRIYDNRDYPPRSYEKRIEAYAATARSRTGLLGRVIDFIHQ
ncbi:radical SAM protein [archaeon]|nr:radical SAM protein [archaeon]